MGPHLISMEGTGQTFQMHDAGEAVQRISEFTFIIPAMTASKAATAQDVLILFAIRHMRLLQRNCSNGGFKIANVVQRACSEHVLNRLLFCITLNMHDVNASNGHQSPVKPSM